MPMEQHLVAEWLAIAAEQVCHKLRSARFCGIGTAVVGGDPQMLGNGRLHARAIEDLSLDRGAVDGFLRQEFDRKVLALSGIEMRHRTDKDTGALQKLILAASQ